MARIASAHLTSPLHSVSYNATSAVSAEVSGLICCPGSVQHLQMVRESRGWTHDTGSTEMPCHMFITKLAIVLSCYLQMTAI